MNIDDLDCLVTVADPSYILGAAYAAVGGTTIAQYGSGSSTAFSLASGQQTFTLTNTSTQVLLAPSYATTNSLAMAGATAFSPGSFSSASLYSSANYTGFMGSSMTIGASSTSTSQRTLP